MEVALLRNEEPDWLGRVNRSAVILLPDAETEQAFDARLERVLRTLFRSWFEIQRHFPMAEAVSLSLLGAVENL